MLRRRIACCVNSDVPRGLVSVSAVILHFGSVKVLDTDSAKKNLLTKKIIS